MKLSTYQLSCSSSLSISSGLLDRKIMAAAAVVMEEKAAGEEIAIRNSKYVKGVQFLVQSGITHLPHPYVQPPHKRPHLTPPTLEPSNDDGDDIPVVDLAGLKDHRRPAVIQQVRDASHRWGFFQVINHDVAVGVMERMMSVVRRFHELPTDQKMLYYSADPYLSLRFQTSFNPEKQSVLEWRDSLEQRCYPPPEDHHWPKDPTDYRAAATEYGKEVRQLTKLLLGVLSEGLNLSADTLEKAFGEEMRQMYLMNYYPPCPNPELVLGLNAHSDPGGLTVLMQDEVGGLQILNDGKWVDIKPLKNAFIINIADQVEVLSNGRYKSVEHRAIRRIGETARISVVTFCNPTLEAKIHPLAQLTNTDPPLYKSYLFSDYLHYFFSRYYDGKSCLDNFKLPTQP